MNRTIIVTGGTLGDWIFSHIQPTDKLIGCDRGAFFLVQHGFTPDVALGDFDSVSDAEREQVRNKSKQFIAYDPVDKDMTDTAIALEHALAQGTLEILIFGAIGTRMDHTLANLHLLKHAEEQGVRCKIIDPHNEIRVIQKKSHIIKGNYTHITLLPLSLQVTGITLHGFKYPLQNESLTIGQTLGVSNILLSEEGTIEIEQGILLVIQSKD